jgi:hypothetical protein
MRVDAIAGGLVALLLLSIPPPAKSELESYQAADRLAAEHIANFRTADFDVFPSQQ